MFITTSSVVEEVNSWACNTSGTLFSDQQDTPTSIGLSSVVQADRLIITGLCYTKRGINAHRSTDSVSLSVVLYCTCLPCPPRLWHSHWGLPLVGQAQEPTTTKCLHQSLLHKGSYGWQGTCANGCTHSGARILLSSNNHFASYFASIVHLCMNNVQSFNINQHYIIALTLISNYTFVLTVSSAELVHFTSLWVSKENL